MRKDIEIPKVEDISLCVVKELNKEGIEEWNVYLINHKDVSIEGVLVSSKGYGEIKGEKIKTSSLRHFLDVVESNTFSKIEMIQPELFGLTNEYWVSFYLNRKMYDKKYIFLAETILEKNMVKIPIINKMGILIN